jgi:hypothetical protein
MYIAFTSDEVKPVTLAQAKVADDWRHRTAKPHSETCHHLSSSFQPPFSDLTPSTYTHHNDLSVKKPHLDTSSIALTMAANTRYSPAPQRDSFDNTSRYPQAPPSYTDPQPSTSDDDAALLGGPRAAGDNIPDDFKVFGICAYGLAMILIRL